MLVVMPNVTTPMKKMYQLSLSKLNTEMPHGQEILPGIYPKEILVVQLKSCTHMLRGTLFRIISTDQNKVEIIKIWEYTHTYTAMKHRTNKNKP